MSRTLGAADEATLGVAIGTVLEDVAEWLGADTSFVTLVDDRTRVTDEWNWCRPGTVLLAPSIGSPLGDVFGSILEFLKAGHTAATQDAALIDLGPAERQLARRNDVRGVIIAPVRVAGTFLGLVGVFVLDQPRQWEQEEISNLELIASILVQTVVRTRQRGSFEQANARARQIARFVPSPLVMLDGDYRVTWMSPSYSAATGRAPDALIGRPVGELFVAGDVGAAGFGTPGSHTVRLLRADGGWQWTELWWQPFEDDEQPDGTAPGGDQVVLELRDVHDRQLQVEELRRDADHDTLTGALNRLGLAHGVSVLAASGRSMLTAFCDLNGFKQWNDTRGHEAGDAMLRDVAQALIDAVRPSDLVARLGGDEFVVIVVDPSGSDRQGLEERLQDAVSAVAANQGPQALTVAVGVSEPGPASEAGLQRAAADAQMYQRKHGPH